MLNVHSLSRRAKAIRAFIIGAFAFGRGSFDYDRHRVICLLLVATLPRLIGCSQAHPKPLRSQVARDNPVVGRPPPAINEPPSKSDRVISIHALDNKYHGSTAILPDNRLDHQKGSHD